jgi:eukaryotic-like serine/threonine-protein kinase
MCREPKMGAFKVSSDDPDDEELYQQALELDNGEDRERFLVTVCGKDEPRRHRLRRLLLANEGLGDFLEEPAPELIPSMGRHALPRSGDRIGGYCLVELIGEGGMGAVWLAEQQQPVRRQVAIKIIKPGMDSRQVIARFEAERQALSMMDHPNIAKVMDAGTSEDGCPYFVMEWVQGQSITEYCDHCRLDLRERLELFLSLCHAIQHAHQKGIIHRDIKPSNVLIALYDDRPVPKVIDFGIAKAIHQPLADQITLTGLGQIVGTIEYMSPEQAMADHIDVDTRSDIYSLGVLLYELLTGSTPFDRKQLRAVALDELLRIIREEDPPRPSTKLSTGETLADVAANRRTDSARLTILVRAELDWIVMKTLEKDRNRRYKTVGELAQDIERYLKDEPVAACPPSAAYRLSKFARRNRALVATTIMVSAALFLGLVGTTWQAIRATRAERIAVQNERLAIRERDEKEQARLTSAELAERERQARGDAEFERTRAVAAAQSERQARENEVLQRKYSDAIADFLMGDLLALTSTEGQQRFDDDAGEGISWDSKLIELLDRASNKLESRQGLEPHILAKLHWILGVNFRGAGELQRAVGHLEKCLEMERSHRGDDDPDTLIAAHSLVIAYEVSGDFKRAEQLCRHTLDSRKQVLGESHADYLQSLETLGRLRASQGEAEEAEAIYLEAAQTARASLGEHHKATQSLLHRLAQVYVVQGKLSSAEPILEETVKSLRQTLGDENFTTLNAMTSLASLYDDQARYADSEILYRQVLEGYQLMVPPEHPYVLAAKSNLAALYYHQGRYSEAVDTYRQLLEVAPRVLGEEHPHTLGAMNNLAGVLMTLRSYDEALELFEALIKVQRRVSGDEHPSTLSVANNLAKLYKLQGRLAEAEPLQQQVLRAMEARFGLGHPQTLSAISNLASIYESQGRLPEANSLCQQALDLRLSVHGPDHPATLESLSNLASIHFKQGDLVEAESLHQQALDTKLKILGDEHPSTAISLGHLALIQYAREKFVKSEKLYQRTYEIRSRVMGGDHPSTLGSFARFLLVKAYALVGSENQVEAEEHLAQALPIFEQLEPKSWMIFDARSLMGEIYLATGRIQDAENYLLEGWNGLQQSRESQLPPKVQRRVLFRAAARIVRLYTTRNQPESVLQWSAEMESLIED